MSKWVEYKFGALGTVITGKTPSKDNPKDWGNEMPFVTPTDYKHYRKYAFSSIRKLSADGVERLQNKILPEESILVTCIGSDMGKVVMNKCKVITNQQINSIIPNKEIVDKDFLYYRLVSMYDTLRMYGGDGTAVPIVNKGDFENIETEIPNPIEQIKIASILVSIDNKIDLLYRQNTTLEKLSEALFNLWFIEFSENKNEELISTEIGFIPKSFKLSRIEDIPHVLETGKRPKGGVGTLLSGMPSIGAENIKGLGVYDYSREKHVSCEYAENMSRGIINGYELLIYKDGGTPGHFIPRYTIFGKGFPYKRMVINEHVFKLDFGMKSFNFFAYYFFQTPITESILVANGAKAAIPGINQNDINKLWIFSPDNELVRKYGDITLPYLEKILFNCTQIRTLSKFRDTLLPKLMSGEVTIEN